MKTSPASPAPELWPETAHAFAFRPSGGKLILEIPSQSETPLLAAIGYAIHFEMRAAGEWAACLDEPHDNGLPSAKHCLRHRAENASRLLALYTSLHKIQSYMRDSDLSPEAMRVAATRSYHAALRDARANRQPEPASLAA